MADLEENITSLHKTTSDSGLIGGVSTNFVVTAAVVHSVIFLVGLSGNGVLLLTAWKTKSLHSPTYSYLVILA